MNMNTKISDVRQMGRFEASMASEAIPGPERFNLVPSADDYVGQSLEKTSRLRQALETCLRYYATYFRE